MKKLLTVFVLCAGLGSCVMAHAATMVCQTISGQQFVWVGQMCPAGSIFISF